MNLSSSNEVYTHIHKEEGPRGVMNLSSAVEKSTFISTSCRGGNGGSFTCGRGGHFVTSDDCDRLKCEHCGKSRHLKDLMQDACRIMSVCT